jgi:hypothetical protein
MIRRRALPDFRLRLAQPAQRLGRRAPSLGRISCQAPKLNAVVALRVVKRLPAVGRHDPPRERMYEHVAPRGEWVRGETDPTCCPHSLGDLHRRPAVVGNLVGNAESEIVPLGGADLNADQQQHTIVHALPAVAASLEGVVIGQQ